MSAVETEIDVEQGAGREMDALLAERLMGWHRVAIFKSGDGTKIRDVNGYEGESSRLRSVPSYSTDIAADFLVLSHVRSVWDFESRSKFWDALATLLAPRTRGVPTDGQHISLLMYYEAGDYSRAALKAMEQR